MVWCARRSEVGGWSMGRRGKGREGGHEMLGRSRAKRVNNGLV